ncbi:MAG: hypothetical protein A2289_20875 [Deltaproteobacteria bacterium RIFOXYA12_FULL_58_15]|nr:MAG: hypothetical protein A2289_20875 [Deltaproteobacteria bacterium RIFOXYA12_FULL_58_15]OGR11934.1 MAG: hypothetical protein A2341_17205 [Deltaproteobacteria bacterium RIFOXYB12_FULL_58_9]
MRTTVTHMLFVLSLCAPEMAVGQTALDRAFAQEIALLESEKQVLQQRIVDAEQSAKARAEELRAQVNRLSEELTAVRIENEVLDAGLAQAPDVGDVGPDRESLLHSIREQATAIFTKHDVNADVSGEVDFIVATMPLAERLGSLRVEQATYFAADGREHVGDVLRIAQVAAIALDEHHGGALAPVTGAAMAVVDPSAAAGARALVTGVRSPTVRLFLFDPLDKNGTAGNAPRTVFQTFAAGGYLMWPILLLALVGSVILVERCIVLSRKHSHAQILDLISKNRRLDREQLEDLVAEAILAKRPTLERFLPAVNVIAVVAPLLGLLGTVTGMIAAFAVITEHGTGDPRLLSEGISEALLTTQFGLLVAIPALLAHALLVGRVDRIIGEMECAALRLLNRLHCETSGCGTGDCVQEDAEAGRV